MRGINENLLARIQKLEREVERLKVKESPIMSNYGRPVFLSAPLTNSDWMLTSGGRSTTSATKIDLSADFGVPDGIKAVLVRLLVRDSATFPQNNIYVSLGPTATAFYGLQAFAYGNDIQSVASGIVVCSGGDIYYRVIASGSNTLDAQLEIWGYWL